MWRRPGRRGAREARGKRAGCARGTAQGAARGVARAREARAGRSEARTVSAEVRARPVGCGEQRVANNLFWYRMVAEVAYAAARAHGVVELSAGVDHIGFARYSVGQTDILDRHRSALLRGRNPRH